MLEIPGGYGSGSGTIVRLAVAFSALTGKTIKITDIRVKRPSPGLHHQHLEAIRTIAKICSADIEGDEVGSKEIEFKPGKIKAGTFNVNIETAGSIGLLSYAALIPAIFGKGKTTLKITGGSTASLWAPPVVYLENVLLPLLSRMSINAKFTVRKHGFYPQGGSDVILEIEPVHAIKPIVLDKPGEINGIRGYSIASKLLQKNKVAERQIDGYHRIIRKEKGVEIKPLYVESKSPGSVILIWAETSTGCILSGDHTGEERKPAEVVGEEAAFKLKEEMDFASTVGIHLADQLIPFMALAKGKSVIITPDLSEHINTNIWLCEKFLNSKFMVKEEGENFRITCSGK